MATGAVALGLTVVAVAFWPWVEPADAAGESTQVLGAAEGGSLRLEFMGVELGSRAQTGDGYEYAWTGLGNPGAPVALGAEPILVSEGPVRDADLTEARFVIAAASIQLEGAWHALEIPMDTLRLHLPGAAGSPGDSLLVVWDVAASVREEAGQLVFHPEVAHIEWQDPEVVPEGAGKGGATPAPKEADKAGASGTAGPVGGPERSANQPEAYHSDSSDPDAGDEGDEAGSDTGPPPDDLLGSTPEAPEPEPEEDPTKGVLPSLDSPVIPALNETV